MKHLVVLAAAVAASCSIGFVWGRRSAEAPPIRRLVDREPSSQGETVSYWPLDSIDDEGRLHISFAPRRLQAETVRLRGVYLPQQGEPWHQEAVDGLIALLDGSPIALDFEGDRVRRDAFGRLHAYVWAHDGESDFCVNLELVRLGLARFERQESGSMDEELAAAELGAQAAGRGLWSSIEAPPGSTDGD